MNDIRPRKPVYHDKAKLFVHPELKNAKHVFIRVDSHTTPLQAPYKGLHPVIKSGDRVFKVNINGKTDSVTIGILEPAFIIHQQSDEPHSSPILQPSTSQPHTNTKSGRHVKFPDRLKY